MKANDNFPPLPPEPKNMTRRLLSHHEVAKKIGYTSDWFYRNRQSLEAKGFPQPVLGSSGSGKGKGVSNRWDEKAIDLWLDSKMAPGLLSVGQARQRPKQIDQLALQANLAKRIQSISI